MSFVIAIEYEVKTNSNDQVVDSNKGHAPLEFISGKGHIIPGLENALLAMGEGDSGEVIVTPAEAYGDKQDDLIQALPKEQFEGIELQEGMILHGQGQGGQPIQVTVRSFNDEEVVIDYNHPLAGEELTFNVTVLTKREATDDERLTGEIGGGKEKGECCGGGCGHH